jgi:hypothetical protein
VSRRRTQRTPRRRRAHAGWFARRRITIGFATAAVLVFGLLLWARLVLVTGHPRTATAEPRLKAPAPESAWSGQTPSTLPDELHRLRASVKQHTDQGNGSTHAQGQ